MTTVLELSFAIRDVRIEPRAAGPTLVFTLAVASPSAEPVFALALRTRISIDARRRRYARSEQERLTDLFGEPASWDRNLHALPWVDVATMVPGFEREVEVGLWVACTHDMDLASSKYLHGIDGADVPLDFLFSGTAFVRGASGIAVVSLPGDAETTWRMPARTWRDLMETYYPGHRIVRVTPATFDALVQHRARRALPSWDATIDDLLSPVEGARDEVAR